MYFDYFRVEYILQEVLRKIKDKSITPNIFRIQDDDFIIVQFSQNICLQEKRC